MCAKALSVPTGLLLQAFLPHSSLSTSDDLTARRWPDSPAPFWFWVGDVHQGASMSLAAWPGF